MKRRVLLLPLFFLILAGFDSGGTDGNSRIERNGFTAHDSKNYYVEYPSGWVVRKEDRFGIHFVPKDARFDIEGFKVFSFKVPFDTETYTKTLLTSFEVYNYQIIGSGPSVLDSHRAHKLVYVGMQGSEKFKWLRVYMVKEQRLYDLYFTFREQKFGEYSSAIRRIIDSFRLK